MADTTSKLSKITSIGLLSLVTLFMGLIAGFLVGLKPKLLAMALIAGMSLLCFFTYFETTVIGLLILRTSLDIFSDFRLPAAFGLGMIVLTLLYVLVQLLTRQPVKTDGLWWFLILWLAFQALWVILLPLGGLGLDGSYLSSALREWIRLFAWLMVYLLVMQLKGRVPPEQMMTLLFWGLAIPLALASLQLLIPSALPERFLYQGGGAFEAGTRINGSLGHPNTFTSFLYLFIGLSYWKQRHAQFRTRWLWVLGAVVMFFVATKALFGLMMLTVFLFCILVPRMNAVNVLGAIALLTLVLGLFASTEFGQERLSSIAETPLLNPDMDIWKAILLSQGDGNSFNWRLSQWHYLLTQWQNHPWLGFGLGLGKYISTNGLEPHNDYVRALVEGGIIGFTSFLTFIGAQAIRLLQLIRRSAPNSAQQDLSFTLLALLAGLSVGMITENIWTHTTYFFYWFTVFAVAGWDWKTQNQEEDYA
ncbi:O-antigen ligase family protein [Roseofilum sp. BLCC_M91]|uniref:O-antigen ligase family protein n=1 Tax=Roseofilum halophilum BLCC-M91 TaxID=3022259 RepID=A0ABT7BMA1_9CYAN|nr:O-antigen ligase family protein [Roseofilum halophilum]MDJ1180296.1 O-antigen ligase family protein [Roseofilum halophilum BLCC-M91]